MGGSFSGGKYTFPQKKREVLGERARQCDKSETDKCAPTRPDELHLPDGTRYLLTNMEKSTFDELVCL